MVVVLWNTSFIVCNKNSTKQSETETREGRGVKELTHYYEMIKGKKKLELVHQTK